jgi:hypothetical protein
VNDGGCAYALAVASTLMARSDAKSQARFGNLMSAV